MTAMLEGHPAHNGYASDEYDVSTPTGQVGYKPDGTVVESEEVAADTPDSSKGYSQDLVSDDLSESMGFGYRLLSQSENGAMVVYNDLNNLTYKYDPLVGEWSEVSQEITYMNDAEITVTDAVRTLIAEAGDFNSAVNKVYHGNEFTNPRMKAAVLREIIDAYPDDTQAGAVDELVEGIVAQGSKVALGQEDGASRMDGIDSMRDCLEVASSEKVEELIPRIQRTMSTVSQEVETADERSTPLQGEIDPLKMHAFQKTLDIVADPRVDVSDVNINVVYGAEVAKETLNERRQRLANELAETDSQLDEVDQVIDAQVNGPHRRRLFSRVVRDFFQQAA
jgi:hypothetical protein